MDAVPFSVRTPDRDIDDLRSRLRATRWPDADGEEWGIGVDVQWMRDLVAYWADGYDWRAREERLGRLPRVRLRVAGLGIHAVHARSSSPGALPLVLTHGWPDSFWRYTKVIDLLVDPAAHGADPADAFHVVVPDIPGFGYSDVPHPALDSIGTARLWAELMPALGYERFGAAGGDIGSHVSRYLGLDHADRVIGVHRTDGGLPPATGLPDDLTADEREWVASLARWNSTEGGYAAVHRTKPQTLGVGLADSPAGLAAWIVEKLRSWSDCGGDPYSVYTRDEILDDLSIYWFTGTITSSMRMYDANARIPAPQLMRRVEVPSGFSLFPADILRPPRDWLERSTNLVRVTEPARGGHFAPFEQPELYAAELRDFFRPLR